MNEIEKIEPKNGEAVEKIYSEIELDSNAIIHFGSQAQERLTAVSSQMLEGVKSKDIGEAGEYLGNMIATIKGFDIDELDPNKKLSFFDRLLGRAKPLVVFLGKYEETKEQIERISDELERQKGILLNDIESLERLYDANLEYIGELENYIAAAQKKLAELDKNEIPALEAKAKNSGDMLDAQNLRDLRRVRDDLERRTHDLLLTRQVALQALPSIRMVQENNKTLVSKINSTMVNTVPLWKNQLAQTITIYRNQKAGEVLQDAMDLTNELLEANAKNFKRSNAQTKELAERGIFDIESVKLANKLLIESIEESLQIADAGKEARAKAEGELVKLENDLKEALVQAKARTEQLPSKES